MRIPWRALGLGTASFALLAVAGLTSAASTSQAAEGPNPGLPSVPVSGLPGDLDEMSRNLYAWLNVAQTGVAGSIRSLQWARVPIGLAAANITFITPSYVDENGHNIDEGDFDVWAFLVPSSTKERYGISPTITVRTVAFGSIPTEVGLQLRQRTDADGLPVGFHFKPIFKIDRTTGFTTYAPTRIDDKVSVAVTSIKVDGKDLGIGSTCSTPPTAHLDIASELISIHDSAPPFEPFDQNHGFSGIEGGTLNGTLDIPRLQGCTTALGDDISPLLSSAISGDDNPVTVKIGVLGCFGEFGSDGRPLPAKPGGKVSEAGCPPDPSPTVQGIPRPLPFPTEAPGRTP